MYKDMMDTIGMVNAADPELGAAMERELTRQRENIELIASENIVSPGRDGSHGQRADQQVRRGSVPASATTAAASMWTRWRILPSQRACQLFGAKYANVQPHSGAQANLAVYFALLEPGDTVMGMDLVAGRSPDPRLSGQYVR